MQKRMINEPKIHRSVMVEESLTALHVKNQANYIDATVGTGGHTLEILKKGGRVLGLDMDSQMLEKAAVRLKDEGFASGYKLVKGNFADIERIAKEAGWEKVYGVILDLGVSNLHLKDGARGFSFENREALLDMRLDANTQGVAAYDLLNVLRPDQLTEMFSVVMEGGAARWLTKKIVYGRATAPIKNVGEFLDIVKGLKTGKTGLSEGTLPFLALRIAVNSELENLKEALPAAYRLLEKGGRIVVITFHSGEDRIVKKFAKDIKNESGLTPSAPTQSEILINPRARSAKMRVIEKL